jgi:hypothetical protein
VKATPPGANLPLGGMPALRPIQFVLPVEDLREVPPEVRQLVNALQRELNEIQTERGITLEEAESRINAVIGSFTTLANSLWQERAVTTAETD